MFEHKIMPPVRFYKKGLAEYRIFTTQLNLIKDSQNLWYYKTFKK